MELFSADSLARSTKFERSAQKAAALNSLRGRMRSGGQFCPRGKFSLAVQWIVRSGRSFLLHRPCLILRAANSQPDV
jgi:hypothetical protein